MERRLLITAGGTTEQIDSVRGITNFSTGRLGAAIADRAASDESVSRIFYICGKNAARPETDKAEIIPIIGTRELESAVRSVLSENRIDAVVHGMAVSDFRVRAVTNAQRLLELPKEALLDEFYKESPSFALPRQEKLSSGEKDLVLLMEQTPKIISLFSKLAPDALLVGFKLLRGVPQSELLDAAYRLLQKNDCDYVLANDAAEFDADRHIGYLIDRNRQTLRYETKAEIAEGIARLISAHSMTTKEAAK